MGLRPSIRFWLLAWVTSMALWMVLADSVRIAEIIVGIGVAALAATGFEVVRRQRLAEQYIPLRPLVGVWRVLLRAVPDVWRLTRAAFSQVAQREPARGRVIAMEFGHGGADPEQRGVRAIEVGLGSIAPNTIVIGVDRETGVLLVHQLEPTRGPSDLDPLQLR
ncbi:MAG TPA: Na+/H+ antiporter subunit E [Thermoleophilaceae bacterium]|jgi:multisubunit Na+/H+ antiporter MnhE subunit|nr:Na+/H+ antiporter subunit E [Thermoleophilaceae bacterium]